MKFRRDLIIAVLATFCLTATVFMAMPTRSSPETTNRLATNQWADINDDGGVDIYDAILLSNDFGTSTDPIKNVSVTNLPLDEHGNLKVSEQKTLQNYTEGMTYNVLDVRRTVNATDFGVYCISCGGFFSFAPKQNFLGVTKLGVVIEAFTDTGNHTHTYNYTVEINYHQVEYDDFELIDYYPTSRVTYADPNYVKPGVNLIGLQFYEYLFILKIDVYVEYQYQA